MLCCAGVLVALPCAFLLKRFQGTPSENAHKDARKDLAFSGTVYEIALVVMSAYMAYLTAEVGPLTSLSPMPQQAQVWQLSSAHCAVLHQSMQERCHTPCMPLLYSSSSEVVSAHAHMLLLSGTIAPCFARF